MTLLRKLWIFALMIPISPLAYGDDPTPQASQAPQNLEQLGNFIAQVKGQNEWADNLVPFAVFLMVVILVWLKRRSQVQLAQARLEAIKILAEKGQPVSEATLLSMGDSSREKRSPLSRAVTFISIGIGFLTFGLVTKAHGPFWALGVAFLAMGIGNLWIAKKTPS